MKGIHPSIVSHRLNVLPTARPVRQRVRRFHPDRQKIIRDEIDKLLGEFIREVEYPDWLANVVVVPKKEGKWRVCVDYTNLNNACPKDSFPLPRIDQIVDSTAGQGMLSFLDAFSGYHQIPMSPADEEKTTFITPHEEHVLHLQEVFHLLRKYDMKLNPSKCAFSVSVGKFTDLWSAKGDRAHSQHPAQAGPNRKNASMGHRVERIWNRVPTRLSMKGQRWWTLRVDGASRSSGSGVGLLLQSPTREQLEQAIRLGFFASNNEAEYEAILSGLDLALALSVSRLRNTKLRMSAWRDT
ncbi:hypothetical protein AAG906_001834 [Vitis piasezkii]